MPFFWNASSAKYSYALPRNELVPDLLVYSMNPPLVWPYWAE